jgi:hypothetical protein
MHAPCSRLLIVLTTPRIHVFRATHRLNDVGEAVSERDQLSGVLFPKTIDTVIGFDYGHPLVERNQDPRHNFTGA